MTEVLLPDGVGSVMYRAFLGCSSLSLASIPDSARIGFHAFPDSVEREMRHVEIASADVSEERSQLVAIQHGLCRHFV